MNNSQKLDYIIKQLKKLDKHDIYFQEIRQDIVELKEKVLNLDTKVNKIEKRITDIEKKINVMDKTLTELTDYIN